MTNEEYILINREKDVRSLALGLVPEGVDLSWCLRQIEGWQLARKKLPRWAETEGLWYPPRLSMEQCSSEATAEYKKLSPAPTQDEGVLIDLTGGFGVDFSYMARNFRKAIYVEQQKVLCDAARHNFPLLGLDNAEVIEGTAEELLTNTDSPFFSNHYSLIYLDPARRDDAGRKVFAIEDCTPDLTQIQDTLLEHADCVMVKLSPMLDITQALRSLHCVTDVHVVSVRGECKELLFIMRKESNAPGITYHCVNLETNDEAFVWMKDERMKDEGLLHLASTEDIKEGTLLLEPNASILKAGMQDAYAMKNGMKKLHPQSNLFVCNGDVAAEVPARTFRIVAVHDFSKQSLKSLQRNVRQANLTIRNFPSTVADLRKRLKIKEGGNVYLFATTLADGSHALLQCEKK